MRIFGVPHELDYEDAKRLAGLLTQVWESQTNSKFEVAINALDSARALAVSLGQLERWFDPIASGKRLRDELHQVPEIDPGDASDFPELLLHLGGQKWLITPEGVTVLWMLRRAMSYQAGDTVLIASELQLQALTELAGTYRRWSRQRLQGVVDLLQSETATLRPTAAGLLFVLLVNRNTHPERRVPAPRNERESAEISRAMSLPILAFAHALAGKDTASERGIDLYRGWALGELTRRLGRGLHRDVDGIWIEPSAEASARERLREALEGRPGRREAIAAALASYDASRPVLSALNVAFERPSNTRRLCEELIGTPFAGGVR